MNIIYMPKSNRKRSIKKMRGGNCGCDKHIFTGGVGLGPATAVDVGSSSTIPFNTHDVDPISPAMQESTRMDPNPIAPWNPFSGGKRRKNKSKRKSTKKNKSRRKRVRGGNQSFDAILNGPLFSSGNIMGAQTSANIIMGKDTPVLNSPLSNPARPFI
jgi:hypothetical protein